VILMFDRPRPEGASGATELAIGPGKTPDAARTYLILDRSAK
jgi:hypothetical protein